MTALTEEPLSDINEFTNAVFIAEGLDRPPLTDTFTGKCERWSRKRFVRANRRDVTSSDVSPSEPLLSLVRCLLEMGFAIVCTASNR